MFFLYDNHLLLRQNKKELLVFDIKSPAQEAAEVTLFLIPGARRIYLLEFKAKYRKL